MSSASVADARPRDRGPEHAGPRRVALLSLLAAAVIAAAKLAVGIAAGSISVLSDGLHSTLDAGATGLTLVAVRVAAKPPDREHPYGHGRAENVAALVEAALMVSVAALVGLEALRRLLEGETLNPPVYALVVMGASVVVDAVRAVALRRAARRYASPALEADAMNFTADILGSVAVVAGLLAARAGSPAGDPAAALVVVLLVWGMAGRIGWRAAQVLMDRRPPGGVDEDVGRAAVSVDGVVEVPSVRVRQSGAEAHAEITVRIGRTHSVERSHEIAEAVREAVSEAVPGTSSVVRVEPSEATDDLVDRTFAAANRVGLADQVHNVLAVHHPEGIWLMLHAKVPPPTPLGRAHAVSDELEAELRREISGLARVEIHLEPRESQSLLGTVVSAERADLVAAVRDTAERHPPIRRCHEVAATEAAGGLHLVLHCEAPPSETIEAIHEASLRVEDEIHRDHPDVRTVTIHFEPEAGRQRGER